MQTPELNAIHPIHLSRIRWMEPVRAAKLFKKKCRSKPNNKLQLEDDPHRRDADTSWDTRRLFLYYSISSSTSLWIDGVAVWNHAILMLRKRHIKRKAIETGGVQLSRQPGQTCPSTMPAFLSCSRGFCGLWVGRADHPSSESPQNAFWWREVRLCSCTSVLNTMESFLNCLWSEIFRGRGVALIHCIYHCFTHMVLVYWQWNNQVQFVYI